MYSIGHLFGQIVMVFHLWHSLNLLKVLRNTQYYTSEEGAIYTCILVPRLVLPRQFGVQYLPKFH